MKKDNKLILISFIAGISLLLTGFLILIFIINSQKDIFPNKTTIKGIDVSLLSIKDAKEKVKTELGDKNDFALILNSGDISHSTKSSSLKFEYMVEDSIQMAFDKSHNDLTLKKPNKLINTLLSNQDYSLLKTVDTDFIYEVVSDFSNKVDIIGHAPFAQLSKTNNPNSLEVDTGKIGLKILQDNLSEKIIKLFEEKIDYQNITVDSQPINNFSKLDKKEQELAKEKALLLLGQKILLISNGYKDVKLNITDQKLVSLLSFPDGVSEEKLSEIILELNKEVKRDSRNAIFDYKEDNNGNFIVNKFIPHLDGLEIDQEQLKVKINEVLTSIINSPTPDEIKPTYLDLPLKVVEPDITLEGTNDLGIKELIGFGDSEYDHSIPNRIWNVSLATEKMNNILVAPGEEFRFNNALGEVSRRTGYRSAYIISGGKTVLGDGGGVCQVSTTYFRAILDAGLEVTKRKAHSYRVSYYELNQKPGIDATVYSGDVDLRFMNDTGKHILIRSSADANELYMKVEIYGTSDGRTTEIVDHKTWGQRGAPASAYYPTTDLPTGVIKQIDWAVSGIKASFTNVIKDKSGKVVREEDYYSNYVPWSAKYLQGV